MYFELYGILKSLPPLLDLDFASHRLFTELDFPGTRLLSTAIQSSQSPFPINLIDHCELSYR